MAEPWSYRVVRVGDLYYLQFKKRLFWSFAHGYHRGAPGMFNYQYCTASNPYFHLTYTIPEIERERQHPTIIHEGSRSRMRKPGPIEQTYTIEELREGLPAWEAQLYATEKPQWSTVVTRKLTASVTEAEMKSSV